MRFSVVVCDAVVKGPRSTAGARVRQDPEGDSDLTHGFTGASAEVGRSGPSRRTHAKPDEWGTDRGAGDLISVREHRRSNTHGARHLECVPPQGGSPERFVHNDQLAPAHVFTRVQVERLISSQAQGRVPSAAPDLGRGAGGATGSQAHPPVQIGPVLVASVRPQFQVHRRGHAASKEIGRRPLLQAGSSGRPRQMLKHHGGLRCPPPPPGLERSALWQATVVDPEIRFGPGCSRESDSCGSARNAVKGQK